MRRQLRRFGVNLNGRHNYWRLVLIVIRRPDFHHDGFIPVRTRRPSDW